MAGLSKDLTRTAAEKEKISQEHKKALDKINQLNSTVDLMK